MLQTLENSGHETPAQIPYTQPNGYGYQWPWSYQTQTVSVNGTENNKYTVQGYNSDKGCIAINANVNAVNGGIGGQLDSSANPMETR